jgi:hypothetical protein
MGTHPVHGVEGFRTKDFTDGSFTLPDALKERLRRVDSTSTSNMQDEDVEEDFVQKATKMTTFVQSIYAARDWVRSGKRGKETDIFVKFIRSTGLGEEEAWTTLGELPTNFVAADHGFVVKVPHVAPGTQLIMWNTWYTNAAGGKGVVATIDLAPVSYFDPEELAWYQYLSQHAPSDLGGSGGAYQTFLLKASEKATTYGLPDEYMEMFTSGHRHMATDSDDMRGLGTLFETQKQLLHQQGYLVVDIPPHLVERLPVEKSLRNIDQFHEVCKNLTSRRDTTKDPLNPFVKQMPVHKTRIAYTLEPFHVAFQYTSFLHNLLASFYQPGRIEPLLVIQEPFQQQPQSSKWGHFAMNNHPMDLIPWAHRQYRARHGLVSF